jgi:hypothetical protein
VILKAAATREVWLFEFLIVSRKALQRNKPMTFDEMWILGENQNELLLTAEDCVFLQEVGIRPSKSPHAAPSPPNVSPTKTLAALPQQLRLAHTDSLSKTRSELKVGSLRCCCRMFAKAYGAAR